VQKELRDRLLSYAGAIAAFALLYAGVMCALNGRFSLAFSYRVANIYDILREQGLTVACLWLGAAGLGMPLSRALVPNSRRPWLAQISAGMAVLLLLDWLLGHFGLLNPWTAWGLCAVGVAMLFWQLADRRLRPWYDFDAWPNPPWTLLLLLPMAGLLIVTACCPPGTLWWVEGFAYDVKSYHLQLPREWLSIGGIVGLPHNVYSYLPNLVEAGYMQLGAMHGGMFNAIYAAQLFHAAFIPLTCLMLASLVSAYVGRSAGGFIAAVFIATPWVVITGSLAYNEIVVLFFAAAAMLVFFDDVGSTRRGAVLIGILLAAAALAKLTAALFVALPLLVLMAARLSNALQWRQPANTQRVLQAALVAAAVSAAVVSPWLARNAIWTANPVFPFAQDMLGHGHWNEYFFEKWQHAHSPKGHTAMGPAAFSTHWLTNAGYGAIGGAAPDADPNDVTRFHREGGVPLLILCAAAAAALLLAWKQGRRAALAMLLMLAIQLLVWYLFTHRQSRFLLPTVLPLTVLVGMGFGRLDQLIRARLPWACPTIAVLVALVMTINAFDILFHQTHPRPTPQGLAFIPPEQLVDAAPRKDDLPTQPGQFEFGDHPINFLPNDSATLMVGDAGSMLYIRRRVNYHTAHDPGLLGTLIQQHNADLPAVTKKLRELGFTHVWLAHGDVRRLQNTYGFDPRLRAWFDLSDATAKRTGIPWQARLQRFAQAAAAVGWQLEPLRSNNTIRFRLP